MSALAQAPVITIETYRPEFMQAIGELIVPIQRQEFGIPITYEDQPDLKKIPAVYQKANGNFWMALEDDRLIGTIALIDVGNNTGVIRKMFVSAEHRGSGIAQHLLDTLIEWARVKKFNSLYLGTIDKFAAAQRFYEKNKFSLIANDALPPAVNSIRMVNDNRHYCRIFA